MVKMDLYARVRRVHRDGLGVRALARLCIHSRREIREILAMPVPKPYVRLNPPPSIADPLKSRIDAILAADRRVVRQKGYPAKVWRRGGCSPSEVENQFGVATTDPLRQGRLRCWRRGYLAQGSCLRDHEAGWQPTPPRRRACGH